jgi:ribosomal protein S27AE
LIKLAVKKVMCPKCCRLRHIKEVKSGAKLQFVCVKCGSTIWQKEGFDWKYLKAE